MPSFASRPGAPPRSGEPLSRSRRGPAGRALRSRPLLLALAVLSGAQACEDTPTGPIEGVLAPETGSGALALDVALPRPDRAALLRGADPETVEAVAVWTDSWKADREEGARRREAAYAPLALALARTLGDREAREDVRRVGLAVDRARDFPTEAFPAPLREGIERATTERTLALRALDGGDLAAAFEHTLRGADALRAIGPEAVARMAVASVEARFEGVRSDSTYEKLDVERLQRLVRGSQLALTEGEWVLAIRRAFYADGLMGGHERRP